MERLHRGLHGIVSGGVLLGLWLTVAAAQSPPITISLVANKQHYQPTEPIQMQITVVNTSGADVNARQGFGQSLERAIVFITPDGKALRTKFQGSTDEPGPPFFFQDQAAALVEIIPVEDQRMVVINNARSYYDLTRPGVYKARVETSLETFSEFSEDPDTGARYGLLNDPGRQGFDPLASNRTMFVIAERQPGDVDGDGSVSCSDAAAIRAVFGKRRGRPGYNANADMNNDGIINVRDLAFVTRKLPAGTRCP